MVCERESARPRRRRAASGVPRETLASALQDPPRQALRLRKRVWAAAIRPAPGTPRAACSNPLRHPRLQPLRQRGGSLAVRAAAHLGDEGRVLRCARRNRKLAAAFLGRMGIDVETAADGRAGLERIEQGDLDLVLMDVEMPEMDGLAATRA